MHLTAHDNSLTPDVKSAAVEKPYLVQSWDYEAHLYHQSYCMLVLVFLHNIPQVIVFWSSFQEPFHF